MPPLGSGVDTADAPACRAVFVNNGWRIANTPGDSPPSMDVVSQFLSAYVPLVRPPPMLIM